MMKKCSLFIFVLCLIIAFCVPFGASARPTPMADVAEVVETGIKYPTVQAAIDAVVDKGYTVKLLKDTEESVIIRAGLQIYYVVLDLNGHVLKGNEASLPTIQVEGYLKLIDSDPTAVHTLTGALEGLRGGIVTSIEGALCGIYVPGEGALDMYGGSIAGNAACGDGAGIFNDSGTVNMYGGAICKNTGTKSGGVHNGGTFTLYDGSIYGNTNTGYGNGAGGVFNNNTFIMKGGSITGNSVKKQFIAKGSGAGLYVQGVNVEDGCVCKIYGGSITGNTAVVYGGGIYVNADTVYRATMIFGGSAKVSGNIHQFSTNPAVSDNLYLCSGLTVELGTGESGNGVPLPESSMEIHVSTYDVPEVDSPVMVTTANTAVSTQYFRSDNADYLVLNDKSTKAVKLGYHEHDWEYTLSKTNADNDTVTAVCKGTGTCTYTGTDTTLTLLPPHNLEYNQSEHPAYFSAKTFLGSSTLPEISYQYKAEKDGTYADAADIKTAGYYRASAQFSDKTACIEYQVQKVAVTISGTTVANKDYDGTTAANVTKGQVNGIISGSDANVAAVGEYDSKNVGSHSVKVTYTMTGPEGVNYTPPAQESFTSEISPLQLSIGNSLASSKTFDGTTAAEVVPGTLSPVAAGDDVSAEVVSAAFTSKHAGKGKEINVVYQLTGKDAGNYLAPVSESLTADIDPLDITVAAEAKTSRVGQDLLQLTYVGEPLFEGDSYTGYLSTEADKSVAGKYPITQGMLSVSDGNMGGNYKIIFISANYIVTTKELQTLSFPGVTDSRVTKSYGDESFTEAVSGAMTDVTYNSSKPEIASIDPATGEVTILDTGTTVIRASAEPDDTYAEAQAQYLLIVKKGKVEIPTASASLEYTGSLQTGVEAPKEAPYSLSGNTAAQVGTYTATATLIDDRYQWSDGKPGIERKIQWEIGRRRAVVTADDKSIFVSDSMPQLTATVTGLVGTDTVSYTIETVPGARDCAGVYEIRVWGEKEQGNYSVDYQSGTLEVQSADVPGTEDISVDMDALKNVAEYYKQKSGDKLTGVTIEVSNEISSSDAEILSAAVGQKKMKCYEADLYLITVENGVKDVKNIGDENDILIPITYSFDFTGRTDLQVFRVHNGQAQEITTTPNTAGEHVRYDILRQKAKVVAAKYSAFAIAYNETGADVPQTGDSSNLPLYIVLASLALGTILFLLLRRKK